MLTMDRTGDTDKHERGVGPFLMVLALKTVLVYSIDTGPCSLHAAFLAFGVSHTS